MLIKGLGKKAQSTAEYAILIALVIGAALAMQLYVKRGLQGKIKTTVDDKFGATQYEPPYLSSSGNTEQESTVIDKTEIGGKISKESKIDKSESFRTQDIAGVKP